MNALNQILRIVSPLFYLFNQLFKIDRYASSFLYQVLEVFDIDHLLPNCFSFVDPCLCSLFIFT